MTDPAHPVDAAFGQPWVVCLCAQWCGACRDYRPLFARVAAAHPQCSFAWVDVEDHAELADDFDVETFPTVLIGSIQGTHFLGPLLPHAETLARLLTALPVAQPSAPHTEVLLAALAEAPADFRP